MFTSHLTLITVTLSGFLQMQDSTDSWFNIVLDPIFYKETCNVKTWQLALLLLYDTFCLYTMALNKRK